MAMNELREKWDSRYRAIEEPPRAAQVLREYAHLLPASGMALDLACGRGGNALLMARAGLEVSAWDLSPVAIQSLREIAEAEGLGIHAEARDVLAEPPSVASFDVIVVSYFLERELVPALCSALRPGGLLFYQTFIRDQVTPGGPSNPDFRLAENELLQLFSGLTLRVYREEGSAGNVEEGFRNEALLVAQRPA